MRWQPIETAVKDESFRLFYVPDHDFYNPILIGYWEESTLYPEGGRWDVGSHVGNNELPTHWMPLPNPPED